jgi:branched-subunit amino acid transport protein
VSSTAWAVVGGCAVVTIAIKATAPVALGGRALPAALERVEPLMAPALLGALIVTNALADGDRLHVGADTAGVAAAGVLVHRTGSVVWSVVLAAVVTAAIRAV